MRRALAPVVLTASLVLATGAAPRREYLRVHDTYTHKLVIYNGFATALMMRATLLTPQLRVAMAEERQRLLEPLPENQATFVALQARDVELYHEIVFAADLPLDYAEGFGPGDDRWNLRLLADGEVEELVEVYRVRDPSPLQVALFPQHNIWSDLWVARFARTVEDPTRVVLHVGSGLGNVETAWEGLP